MNRKKYRNRAQSPGIWASHATCMKLLVVLKCWCCSGLWLLCPLISRALVSLQETVFLGLHHTVVSLPAFNHFHKLELFLVWGGRVLFVCGFLFGGCCCFILPKGNSYTLLPVFANQPKSCTSTFVCKVCLLLLQAFLCM